MNISLATLKSGARLLKTEQSLRVPFVLAVLAAVVTMLFFVQVFLTQSQGFSVTSLEQEALELQEEQKALEVEVAELRALTTIQKRADELNMQPVGEIVYVDDRSSNEVALVTE